MIEAILQRGTLVTVVLTMLLFLGTVAALRVPVQMIPDIDTRVVTIVTRWPGATPQDVEKEILIEQEEYLRGLPNLKRITSFASTGRAEIELEFPFGTEAGEVLLLVNNALSQVPSYPENVDEPVIRSDSFSYSAFLMFQVVPLPGNPQNVDINMQLDFVEDHVRPLLERIEGVSQINVSGGAERQIRIVVDPAKLAARNLSLSDVRNAIRERNVDRSAGDIDSGKRRYLIRMTGRFQDLGDLENMILSHQGDTITRLADVAEISMSHAEIRANAFANGVRNIRLSMIRQTGANVIEIKKKVHPVLEQMNRDLLGPRGMSIAISNDDVRYVEGSISNVLTNILFGACLTAIILMFYLRSGATTLIGILGLPVCVVSGFIGLLLLDRTINVISLAGIAFAIGMTVDNTIVVLESIQQERARGKTRFEAARDGTKAVWAAVLSSTMTTALVFLPLLFVKEEAGQLFSDIGIAIATSIIVSMLVAITLVPAAYTNLPLKGLDKPPRTIRENSILLRGVSWLLRSRLRRWACLLLITGMTIGGLVFLTPPAEYLPEGEEAKSFSTMIAPAGYSLQEMTKIADELNEQFLPAVNQDPALYARGETNIPPIAMLMVSAQPGSVRLIAETIQPKHIGAFMEVVDERMKAYPGMRVFSARGSIISSNDGGTRAVALDISGNDLTELYQTALAVYHRAGSVIDGARINSVPSSLNLGQPLLEISPRWERLSELGLSAGEFGFATAALSDGAFVDEFFLHDDKIDIYLFSQHEEKQTLSNLPDLPYYTPKGGILPLRALADVRETVDTADLRRVNGRRTVTLHIIPPRSMPLETGVEVVRENVIRAMQDAGEIPAGVSLSLTGASDQLDATRASLGSNMWIAVVLCYLQLVIIYRHWGYPFLILLTVPLGIGGAIGGLWLLNYAGARLHLVGLEPFSQPFDMITMLGFLVLLGSVVNNPILIVERTMQNFKEKGMVPYEAAMEAVTSRLRPILMTTVSTLFGLAPLVFRPGAGTELYRGLGALVLFGLAFTAVVTITFLPSLLVTLLNLVKREGKE